ncbi:class I SAM-dependent methyltransferase [Chloroflexota bacterium]
MPPIFWTGKLSLPMKVVLNTSNLLAWITGNARDTFAMKQRMKRGYEGAFSNDISRYDELGLGHYTKISRSLLDNIEVKGKEVIDIGCGTGILSLLALKNGVSKVTCCDISEYMLSHCRDKLTEHGYKSDQVDFHITDAEEMPFEDNSFDIAFSSMVLGLAPNQSEVMAEIYRIVKSGGLIALATHGTEHYAEASEATVRKLPKRYVLGYRMEFFPISERNLQKMLIHGGFTNVKTSRVMWKEDFKSGSDLYDFFVSTSSGWWYDKLPSDKITIVANNIKRYLDRKRITQLSQDVVLAFGNKPVN